jgi:hypothetical protein
MIRLFELDLDNTSERIMHSPIPMMGISNLG